MRFDDFAADNVLLRVITALDQDIGQEVVYEAFDALFGKDADMGDALQSREQSRSVFLWDYGAARAFEGMYALVVIEPNGQAITQCAGLAQIFDVAAMEQVEAAVGEDYSASFSAQLLALGNKSRARKNLR